MRSLFRFTALFIAITACLSACENNKTHPCPNAGPLIRKVIDLQGTIDYDSTQSIYYVRVPNSSNSYDIGYICTLADETKNPGMKIKFSGRYYACDIKTVLVPNARNYYLAFDLVEIQ